MELATNTFSKGLLMDTNPMVLGTDTLTDCLNGTLITMNGNEVILLNDMGNRRVNNAFLPSGYLPVGMKEYGGIIYVAAYNPITNKSLIGSFPSPLKKIDNNLDADLGGNFTFSDFKLKDKDEYLGINVLKSDSFLVPISGKNSLRAGDKFAIYSPNIENYKDDISNYANTEDGKVISPKNKKYTLSVGILNSQNEFVDITKTLCRWDDNSNIISYDSSYSDLYKFNDGYFISKEFRNIDLLETIEDAKLIKLRQKIAANTYAYKLIGPMYLKVAYNHIENFNYNIYGVREEDEIEEVDGEIKVIKKATLWIEGYFTYNCPDRVTTQSERGDLNYISYEEGLPKFNGFDLFAVGEENPKIPVFDDNIELESSIYDPNTNTYTVKIVKKYVGVKANNGNNFEYVLGVDSEITDLEDNKLYIRGLSVKSSIDLSLLGSGILKVKGWQFYNAEDRVILSLSLDAYPRYNEEFKNLNILLSKLEILNNNDSFELKSTDSYSLTLPKVYNGKLTINIYFGEEVNENSTEEIINNFEKDLIYRVSMSYESNDGVVPVDDIQDKAKVITSTISNSIILNSVSDDNVVLAEETEEFEEDNLESSRWILTTHLFNEFYNNPNIPDFCTTENQNFLNKLNVELETTLLVEDNSLPTVTEVDSTDNSLISRNYLIKYTLNHTYNILYNHNSESEFYIVNLNLYPLSINGKNNLQFNTAQFIADEISNINNSVARNTNGNPYCTGSDHEGFEWVKGNVFNTSDTEITSSIEFKDHFCGYTETSISNIKNIFDKVLNIIDRTIPTLGKTLFCGLSINWDDIRGGGDGHLLDYVAHTKPIHTVGGFDRDGRHGYAQVAENSRRIVDVRRDDVWQNLEGQFRFRDYSNVIFQLMNSDCPKLLFTYLNVYWNSYSKASTLNWGSGHEWDSGNYPDIIARVWWRSTGDKWAHLQDVGLNSIYEGKSKDWLNNNSESINSNVNTAVINAIRNKLGDYIYCIWDSKTDEMNSNNLTFYATKNPTECYYNNKYSFNITVLLLYELSANITINHIKIGNLDFDISLPKSSLIKEINIPLESSDLLGDNINRLDTGILENIYLGSGSMFDIEGNKLNPKFVYIEENGNLRKVENNKFFVDTENKGVDGINLLLYAGNTLGCPEYRFAVAGHTDGDNATSIDYNGIQIVELP